MPDGSDGCLCGEKYFQEVLLRNCLGVSRGNTTSTNMSLGVVRSQLLGPLGLTVRRLPRMQKVMG